MKDPFQEILNGVDPDTVLVRVRSATGANFAMRRDLKRPIDYLRYRSKKPISESMFLAGEIFAADHQGYSHVGSNTAATLHHMEKEIAPWSAADAERMRSGTVTKPRFEVHVASDPSDRMLDAALRVKRIEQKLDKVHYTLLRDLLIRELTLGSIAQRWGWHLEAVSVMVRHALACLVKAYEELNPEFAEFSADERENERT